MNEIDYNSINKSFYNKTRLTALERYKNNKNALKNVKMEMGYSLLIRKLNKKLISLIRGNSTKILDLGCGEGNNAVLMATYGADVTAIDISEINIEITKLRAKRNNVKINAFTKSCTDTNLSNDSYDIILGSALVHHLTEDVEELMWQEVFRLLKPGGSAIFIEPIANSKLLEFIRLLIPITMKHNPRPSILQKSYKDFKKNDPHPERINTISHYNNMLNNMGFSTIEIMSLGIFSRLDRLTKNYKLRKLIHDMDYVIKPIIPFNNKLARNIIITLIK